MRVLKNATLYLWIYNGVFGEKDLESPSYVLYKEKQSSKDVITFEIASLVKDYIEVNFTGDYENITQTSWAEWKMDRSYEDGTSDSFTGSAIAFNGYGYFEDKINPQLSTDILISNTIICHKCDEQLYIPILSGEDGVFKVTYIDSSGAVISEEVISETVTALRASTTKYSADTIDLTADVTYIKAADSEVTKDLRPPLNTSRIDITLSNGSTKTLFLQCIDCSQYTPYKVSFLNKFGVVQDIWFDKVRKENAQISKEQYLESTISDSAAGVSYSLNRATKIPHNFTASKGLTLNTGFVPEEYNEVIQQLLLTERAWIHEDDNVFPIIPKTSSLQYKNRINDKLINFTIDFDYAYNEINNIK